MNTSGAMLSFITGIVAVVIEFTLSNSLSDCKYCVMMYIVLTMLSDDGSNGLY
jgi:hypothetical protein